jgi:hypothetical protein
MAAGAGATAPSVAVASIDEHEDRQLVELGREYFQLEVLLDAADEQKEKLRKAYLELQPVPSDVMRHRIQGHFQLRLPIRSDTTAAAEPEHSDFYSEDEVACLPHAKLPIFPSDVPAHEARVAEIVAEWERWNAECEALKEQIGLASSEAAIDEMIDDQRSLAKKISSYPRRHFRDCGCER